MKRTFLILCALCFLCLCGCGVVNTLQNDEGLRLYYPRVLTGADGGDAVAYVTIPWEELPQEDTQEQAQTVLALLLGGCRDENFRSPVPAGTQLNACTVQGTTALVDFTGSYGQLDGMDLTHVPEYERAAYLGRVFQDPMMGTAADVLPEHPGLELVCGNQIFSVSSSNIMLLHTIGNKHEGSSQVADLDGDGYPEILVRSTMGNLSLYSVKDGIEVFRDAYVMTGYPAIGDIDGDSLPEIVGLTSGSKMAAYKYDAKNKRLVELWNTRHTDRSAQTSMTLFDFNADGKCEIVYRDETSLRIIDGSGRQPVNIASMQVSSATKSEYPVVADVDGDGQAEIVVSGAMYKDFEKDNASINIFSSNRWAWAPAPSWWGEY